MEHNHACSWTEYTIFKWMDFLVISACTAWKVHITFSLIHLSIFTLKLFWQSTLFMVINYWKYLIAPFFWNVGCLVMSPWVTLFHNWNVRKQEVFKLKFKIFVFLLTLQTTLLKTIISNIRSLLWINAYLQNI